MNAHATTSLRLARWLVGAALAAWAAGLLVASIKLHAWQREMAQGLAQVQADALVRASVHGATTALEPHWQRQRAVDLMATVERLHEGGGWTWVMPGSWAVFDDLQERAMGRLGRAFAQGVVQTLRQEIERQAAAINGMPLRPARGEIDASTGCRPALAAPGGTGLAIDAMPAFIAVAHRVDEALRLGLAAEALRRMRQPPARMEDLQLLSRSILGVEWSGPATRSLAWFAAADDTQDPAFDAMSHRLQAALRCGVGAGMHALHQQLTRDNPWLALDDAARSETRTGLFQDDGPQALQHLRAASFRLEALEYVLATQPHAWMHEAGTPFGPEHRGLIGRIAVTPLLGASFAQEVEQDARRWRAQLDQRLANRLRDGPDGLHWNVQAQRLELTPERQALQAGLRVLLGEPFLVAGERDSAATLPIGLVNLVEQHRHCEREVLPLFPPLLRATAAGFVERWVAGLMLARARHWLAQALPGERADRLQQVQANLDAAGAPAWSVWLGARLAGDVLSTPDGPAGPPQPADSAGEPAVPASSSD